ncbi:DUF1310 family protein [Alloscardovia theropitheci]|uniref:DUF1310 family protein n=1 Tax=Alloscardovia theropitheci TaxID=2496842 RepID=A0A4R0QX73_9BIFI|nr:DUF1310 family protein [Alloscardovia theropitheci]TCD53991.1 DUF1310 family protein [Alloscardovia theropitheci]
MKKLLSFAKHHLKLILCGVVVVFVLGGIAMVATAPMREQAYMNEVVMGPEGQRLITEMLKSDDKYAFTDKGRIKSYDIDPDTIERNPMGGIMAHMILNNDPNLLIHLIFEKDNPDQKLEVRITGLSADAYNMYLELGAIQPPEAEDE